MRKIFKNKRGDLLHEQLIFIILNVVFFATLIVFVYLKSSAVYLYEEETAKQIALLIDASKPETDIEINLKDFFNKAEKNGIVQEQSIKIDNSNNLVIVKGSEDTSYDYSYFNNVDVEYNFNGDYLILVIK